MRGEERWQAEGGEATFRPMKESLNGGWRRVRNLAAEWRTGPAVVVVLMGGFVMVSLGAGVALFEDEPPLRLQARKL